MDADAHGAEEGEPVAVRALFYLVDVGVYVGEG